MYSQEKSILYSHISGKGTPLIILHGLLGMGENWMRFSKKWSDSFQVHLLDMRNHGYSFHSPNMSYEHISEDVKQYLDHHRLEKVSIIGHSMGGKAVMNFCDRHPEYVRQIIVVDIAPKSYSPAYQEGIFKGLFSFDPKHISRKSEASAPMRTHIASETTINFLLKSLKKLDGSGYRWLFNLEALYNNLGEILSFQDINSCKIPALFIQGEQSDYITDLDRKKISDIFKQVEMKTIQNAGHWVHAENPGEFYSIADNFLRKQLS